MPNLPRHCRRIVSVVAVFIALCGGGVSAEEIWVAPTHQQDVGGLSVASNVVWPVTAIGAVRLALAIPDDLQTFQSAKIVLLPNSPSGAANLVVYVCGAQPGSGATSNCSAATPHPFVGTASQLVEVDISAAVAARVGVPGVAYLGILAYSTPTTNSDRIVGMRVAYDAAVPPGAATLGANTFSDAQTAPAFVGDGASLTNVNATLLDGLDSTAFAAAGTAATLGPNIFTGAQTINIGNLDLDASTATTGNITKNGTRFLHTFGSSFSTFLGENAGNFTMTGANNTGIGRAALSNNTTGGSNTAVGLNALFSNTTGSFNVASGWSALVGNTVGATNAAFGFRAMIVNSTGSNNVAIGGDALRNNGSGTHNVGVGFSAGFNGTTGSNNIYLGANVLGVAGESNTMYLGNVGTQEKTYVAGVRGATTINPDAIPVVIDSAGQLGTVSSSGRFKEDVRDMGDASRRLLQLRPVTFRYTQAFAGGAKPVQYGLIAEEVADVFPELAVINGDGKPETVKYQDLSVLLLNELQKQQRLAETQQERIEALERRLNDLVRARDDAALGR